jgi:uncharacterized membrane protein YebE (DUF533 family)
MGDTEYNEMRPLRTMVDGAKQFGLTDAEVLAAIDACVYEVGDDASVAELLEELSGVLARSIIGKHRRTVSTEQATAVDERRDRSKNPR